MSVAEMAIVAVLAVMGGTVQSAVGFGFGLLTVPFFALIEPDLVPGPAVVFGLVVVVAVIVEERGAADRAFVGWTSVGRVPGSVAGGLLLATLGETGLRVAVAAVVLAAVAMSLVGWRVDANRPTYLGAGVLSGAMSTVASIGGPPLVLTLQDRPAASLRVSVAAAGAVGALISLAVLVSVGRMGVDQWRLVGLFLPAVAVGTLVGRAARDVMAVGSRARRAVYLVSAGGALWTLAVVL